jgi:hypothetical protein
VRVRVVDLCAVLNLRGPVLADTLQAIPPVQSASLYLVGVRISREFQYTFAMAMSLEVL